MGFQQSLTLKKPMRPIKLENPRPAIYRHSGEPQKVYDWTGQEISFLTEAMKFLPRLYAQQFAGKSFSEESTQVIDGSESHILGKDEKGNPQPAFGDVGMLRNPSFSPRPYFVGAGRASGFRNLDLSPGAIEFNPINHYNAKEEANDENFAYLEEYSQEIIIGGQKFIPLHAKVWQGILDLKDKYEEHNWYEIAVEGLYEGAMDEEGFSIMASMVESRRRYYGAMTELFGSHKDLANDEKIISAIDEWLNDPLRGKEAYPSNLMIFQMYFAACHGMVNALEEFFGDGNYLNAVEGLDHPKISEFRAWLNSSALAYQSQQNEKEVAQAELDAISMVIEEFNDDSNRLPRPWQWQTREQYLDPTDPNYLKGAWDQYFGLYPNPASLTQWEGRYSSFAQTAGLSPSQLQGLNSNTLYFEENWVVHAYGLTLKQETEAAARSLSARTFNRGQVRKYRKEVDKYYEKKDEAFWDKKYDQKIRGRKLGERKAYFKKIAARKEAYRKQAQKMGGKMSMRKLGRQRSYDRLQQKRSAMRRRRQTQRLAQKKRG